MKPMPTADLIWPTSGNADGNTMLNAFDNALLDAGIGNVNLDRLSSIIPANVKILDARPADMNHGDIVHTIYARQDSSTPGETIAAAVAIGFAPDSRGVAFEHEGPMTKAEAESMVRQQVADGFRQRGLELKSVLVISAEHVVEKHGCALAAVALWWTQ